MKNSSEGQFCWLDNGQKGVKDNYDDSYLYPVEAKLVVEVPG